MYKNLIHDVLYTIHARDSLMKDETDNFKAWQVNTAFYECLTIVFRLLRQKMLAKDLLDMKQGPGVLRLVTFICFYNRT
ncbi:hypothetical protein EB796_025166 [Bugula neritina]|uniref:Uncharacterized protein n=1 Tax=Bugula neritina TaxID=10212 RepID=A0A7J7ISZ8_BUGNE|nr:hypothetical protein EB796_025166 [Bugula neritina]